MTERGILDDLKRTVDALNNERDAGWSQDAQALLLRISTSIGILEADGKRVPVPFTCSDGSKCQHGWWCSDTYCQGKCEFRKAPVVQNPLTDEQIEALGHRIATKYTHRSDPASHSYGFMRHTLIDFARAIERHGICGKPQRTDPLTDEQVNDLADEHCVGDGISVWPHAFARAIEKHYGIGGGE